MKSIQSLLLAFIVMCANCINCFATPSKGVQAVLLHRWSSASTSLLIRTLSQYRGNEIEISFAPNVAASASDPYKNIRAIIDGLPNKKIFAVIYLNFHATNSTVNGLDQFKIFFLAYRTKAQIIVSPSLEDHTNVSAINIAAKNIAVSVGVTTINSLILRRSPDVNYPTSLTADIARPSGVVEVNKRIYRYKSVEVEKHGTVYNTVGADVYSNDGVFVYNPDMTLSGNVKESSQSFLSINTTTKYSLNDFKNKTASSRTNLWRPAYNMYRDCRGNYLNKNLRTFSDCNNKAFDSEEAKTLAVFLNIQ